MEVFKSRERWRERSRGEDDGEVEGEVEGEDEGEVEGGVEGGQEWRWRMCVQLKRLTSWPHKGRNSEEDLVNRNSKE